jgi:hypothetical protein
MDMIVYAGAKFLAYSAWCYLALRLVQPAAATLGLAARFGLTRWLLGLVFGIIVFFALGSIDAANAARLYVLVYTPVRAVEWAIMALLIGHRLQQDWRSTAGMTLPLWCVGGMLVSFLTDLLSPEGLQGRFCVGRCLC